MKAKDMFEALGYKIVSSKDEEVLIYFSGDRYLYFILKETHIYGKSKGYGAYIILDDSGKKIQTTISINLHLAITQQMKELGWIEE